MKMIADLPEYIVKEIRLLISQGRYSSVSDFLLTASENQISLESFDDNEVLGIDLIKSSIPRNNTNLSYQYAHPTDKILTLETKLISTKDQEWETWIWGQINRILPIKFAARSLAITVARNQDFPIHDEFCMNAGIEARKFGQELLTQDAHFNKPRDKKLSTGFPIGAKKDSSLSRYWSQFIGYQKKDGSNTGALFDLVFADTLSADNESTRIGLTAAGLEFAEFINPVIDDNHFDNALSDDEIAFYLNHIQTYVPGEVSLFKAILRLIEKGINRRENLNESIKNFIQGSNWSNGLISTQRSGAISRMYELGLLKKEKSGLEVQYIISDPGTQFLESIS